MSKFPPLPVNGCNVNERIRPKEVRQVERVNDCVVKDEQPGHDPNETQ